MKFFLAVFFIFLSLLKIVLAQEENDGFYVGVDPLRPNNKIGNIDNSVSLDSKVAEDRYYGYKFGSGGMFIAPEFSSNQTILKTSVPNTAPPVSYNVKANVGYDFNNNVSGFVTYDLGNFSYNSGQKVTIGSNTATSSAVGVGSQINFSHDFGVKIIYTQQQFERSATSGGQVRSNVVKLGTVYNF